MISQQTKLEQQAAAAAIALEPLRQHFAGKRAIVYAAGPSLPALVEKWRPLGLPSIAVKDAIRLVPECLILYATNAEWWLEHKGVPEFEGVRVGYSAVDCGQPIIFLAGSGVTGYDPRLGWVRHGINSGYVAAHLAAQLGATEIILVGHDMKDIKGKAHFFGEHRYAGRNGAFRDYPGWVRNFSILERDLAARGVQLLSGTPGSALTIKQAA